MSPREQSTREEIDSHVLNINSTWNLLDVPKRKLNFRFAVAEWLWMSMGLSDVETLAFYNSKMRAFSDDGERLTGAYGPHICAQLPRIIRQLERDWSTRQAVIEIPRPQDEHTKDNPCSLSLQFLHRRGQLHCIATMRSSDLWLGVPYDTFTFTQIQSAIAGRLKTTRGFFSLHAGSSHLYERDVRSFEVCYSSPCGTLYSPALPGWPPGWFQELLIHRSASYVPADAHPVWRMYADVLLCGSSAEARDILERGATR